MKSQLAALLGVGALAIAGGAQATGVLDPAGPSYSPGTRPTATAVDAPSAAQLAVAAALGTKDRGTPSATVDALLSVGALYEAGASKRTLVIGAEDGAGHQTGVAAGRGDALCVVGIDKIGAGGQCGSPSDVKAGRLMTVGYENGTMRIYGVAPNAVTTATFIAKDGTRTNANVQKNTYLLTVSPQTSGTLELSGTKATVRVPIPDSRPPTSPVVTN